MKKFRLYWLDGKEEVVEGADIADACKRAGIQRGALRVMDYFQEIKEEDPVTSISPSSSSPTP